MGYILAVPDVQQTNVFAAWIDGLRDERAKARILERTRRLALGLLGDIKALGDGVSELRIDYGPGYRVYFIRRDAVIYLLLCGGNKGTQAKDIKRARERAAAL